MLVRDFKGFFFFSIFHTELLATVDYPWRTNVMQLCKRFTPRRVLIFNGSAKLQLLFNWLLGWLNSEYLPVESCSVMKTLVMYGRGPSTPSARFGQRKRAGGGFGTSLCRGQAGSIIVVIVVRQVYFTALAAHRALMSPLKRGFLLSCALVVSRF